MRFVDVNEAREARGVRLVVVGGVPSPWSEAAKGIFDARGIDGLLVRSSTTDESVKQWTGWHNAPVLFVDAEPPRTHWSDILEASERVPGGPSLVPADTDERARMMGLAHELLGENGLVWNGRLLVIATGLATEGREGFPLRLAKYLASKYGYTPEHATAARARVRAAFERFASLVSANAKRGSAYAIGERLSALDIYLATALAPFVALPEALCPGTIPVIRHAFATGAPDVSAAVPDVLRAHRDLVYERHLRLPVEV